MRLAFLSDIHGNLIALDAVLKDIAQLGGVDGYWFLGDYCGIGYDPVTVLERITGLGKSVFVRGNTDRYIFTGDRPFPQVEDVLIDPTLMSVYTDVTNSFAWTQGFLTAHNWLQWLIDLPLEQRSILPDRTRLLAVHASPGSDDGSGFHPGNPGEHSRLLQGSDADLVLVGHTHWPMDLRLGDIRVINVGSISNPWRTDLRASYVLLDADKAGYGVEFRRVEYDHQAVIDALKHVHHPSADYIISHQIGEQRPVWDASS